jgi:hypothetical protein
LQLHRGFAVFQLNDEAVAGVAQARHIELAQGEPGALAAHEGAELG